MFAKRAELGAPPTDEFKPCDRGLHLMVIVLGDRDNQIYTKLFISSRDIGYARECAR